MTNFDHVDMSRYKFRVNVVLLVSRLNLLRHYIEFQSESDDLIYKIYHYSDILISIYRCIFESLL